jgi:DNA-binding Lrp family transcriptional regulator
MTFFMEFLRLSRESDGFGGRKRGGEVPVYALPSGKTQVISAIRRFEVPPAMRDADTKLIDLLRANAREPTASLARKLGLARSTVQERLARLERDGVVKGYTVRLADEAQGNRLRAVVMIETDPKQADRVSVELKKMPEVRSLAALSGSYDLIGMIETDTAARIDALLDRIGRAPGVARTVSSIILSEKFSR